MKITKVNIPSEDASLDIHNNGLSDIKMERLQDLVIIAGKNGSGKTRILERIKSMATFKKGIPDINALNYELESADTLVRNWKKQLKLNKYDAGLQRTLPNRIIETSERIEELRKQQQISQLISTDDESQSIIFVNFCPKSIELIDSYIQTKEELIKKARMASTQIGTDAIHEATLSKIQSIHEKWILSTHHNSDFPAEEVQKATEDYEDLRNIIYRFLKTELKSDNDNNATLFGFRIGDAKLSEGQKILLQLSVAIHSQKTKISNIIIAMDEPENHLHPSVVIDTINTIRNSIPNGQVWIITHSIAILAYYGVDYIHYVEDGKIQFAGNIPEKVLESLLGDDDSRQKLFSFISLPDQMAMEKFAYECLLPPISKETGKDDPQNNQIREFIEGFLTKKKKIKILDYGAGKARLLTYLLGADCNATARINYVAYEPFEGNKELCLNIIKDAYGSTDKRYYNTYSHLKNDYINEFDIVIMCNVLHEIEPNDWPVTFDNLSNLLSPNGYLLLVEDTLLPIGEKAYSDGFIIIDSAEIATLFKLSNVQRSKIRSSSCKNNRLKAHLIPKSFLCRSNLESRKKCLESVKANAINNINDLRKNNKHKAKEGRIHAFWTMQLANVILALSKMEQ